MHEAVKEKLILEVVVIPKETSIWPEYGKRGITQEDFSANELPKRRRIRGFSAYRSRVETELYRDGKLWRLPAGSLFGTNSSVQRSTKKHRI